MKIAASVTPNKTKFGPLLFAGDLERGFAKLSECGYDGIELSLRTAVDIEHGELFNLLKKNGLELISIATGQSYLEDGYSIFTSDDVKRSRVIERLKAHIELASNSSGCVILGGIKGSLDKSGDAEQYSKGMETIETLVNYAEPRNVVLLLESINRYEANIFNTVDEGLKEVQRINSPALRILPDTFHMNMEEVSIPASIVKAGEYVGALHCADSNRLAPGMGHIDFAPIIEAAKTLPNLRYLGVEVLPIPESEYSAATAIKTIKQYL